MDLKQIGYECIASIFIVLQRILLLLFYPYKTMRIISKENDFNHLIILVGVVALYFISVDTVKDIQYPSYVQFFVALVNYFYTVGFVAFFSYIHTKKVEWKSLFFLFAYTLVPTIIWFYVNTFLYVALPPPRHVTFLGKVFSISFITLSVSLLAWKLILWYLAVRFATKLQFYSILFITVLYIALALPYSLLLYHFGFFRIPFF